MKWVYSNGGGVISKDCVASSLSVHFRFCLLCIAVHCAMYSVLVVTHSQYVNSYSVSQIILTTQDVSSKYYLHLKEALEVQ